MHFPKGVRNLTDKFWKEPNDVWLRILPSWLTQSNSSVLMMQPAFQGVSLSSNAQRKVNFGIQIYCNKLFPTHELQESDSLISHAPATGTKAMFSPLQKWHLSSLCLNNSLIVDLHCTICICRILVKTYAVQTELNQTAQFKAQMERTLGLLTDDQIYWTGMSERVLSVLDSSLLGLKIHIFVFD